MLSLEGNDIGGEPAKNIIRALSRNPWMIGINLTKNRLSMKDISHVMRAVLSNAVLSTLRLEGNPGHCPKVESMLVTALSHSTLNASVLPHDVQVLLKSWCNQQNEVFLRSQGLVSSASPPMALRQGADRSQVIAAACSLQLRNQISSALLTDFSDNEVHLLNADDDDYIEHVRFESGIPSSPTNLIGIGPTGGEGTQLRNSSEWGNVGRSQDNRPPSRNSLRPRPSADISNGFSHAFASPMATAGLIIPASDPYLRKKTRRTPLKNRTPSSAHGNAPQTSASLAHMKIIVPASMRSTGSLASAQPRRQGKATRGLQGAMDTRALNKPNNSRPASSTKATKKTRRSKRGSSDALMSELVDAVEAMSNNLSELRQVAETLERSVDLQRIAQRESWENSRLTTPRQSIAGSSRKAVHGNVVDDDECDIDEETLTHLIKQSLRHKIDHMLYP
jgi:hypothetical protein